MQIQILTQNHVNITQSINNLYNNDKIMVVCRLNSNIDYCNLLPNQLIRENKSFMLFEYIRLMEILKWIIALHYAPADYCQLAFVTRKQYNFFRALYLMDAEQELICLNIHLVLSVTSWFPVDCFLALEEDQ